MPPPVLARPPRPPPASALPPVPRVPLLLASSLFQQHARRMRRGGRFPSRVRLLPRCVFERQEPPAAPPAHVPRLLRSLVLLRRCVRASSSRRPGPPLAELRRLVALRLRVVHGWRPESWQALPPPPALAPDHGRGPRLRRDRELRFPLRDQLRCGT